MIADDESAIRNGLAEIVSGQLSESVILYTADNGKDALNLIKKFQPDISIIDINMPLMDGLEVIKQAREDKSLTCFFIISGFDEFSYAQTAIRYGVKFYFLKPLNILEFKEEFIKQCDEILNKKNTKNQLSEQKLTSLVASSRLQFLNQLIQNGVQSHRDITLKLPLLNLSITNSSSCIVLFRIRQTQENVEEVLENINKEYIIPCLKSWQKESWIYNGNQIVAVFNVKDNKDKNFRTKLQECILTIRENTGYKIIIGIGEVTEDLTGCYHSYTEAGEALSYHIYDNAACIYDSSFIDKATPTFSQDNIDVEPLVQNILTNQTDGIKEYCNTFFHSLFFTKMPPPNFVIGMCMYLIMNVQKKINLLYPDKKVEFEFTFDEISRFASIKDLEQWLIDFFLRYSEILKDTAGDSNSIIRTSKEFIQNNLHRNIKTKDVAAQVNLSESYFSIYFKDKTGINFRDYILTARINYAKALLKGKEISISEIAYLIGYQDYRSFSRAFKKETGMSPSEYANTLN